MTLASSSKDTKPPIAMYYICSLTIITCTRLLVLQIHCNYTIYWNIYVGIIDAVGIVIQKVVEDSLLV